MLIFTQSYRDSGLEGLIPLGVVITKVFYTDFGNLDEIIQNLNKQYKDISFIFNSKFEWYCMGHPDNGKYGCKFIGDAYKLLTNSNGDIVKLDDQQNIMIEPKSKIRKGWQFRCGFVILDKESTC